MKRLASIVLTAFLSLSLASAAPLIPSVPTTASTTIAPNGASNPYTLGALNSATNYQVPRTHIGVWKPYGEAQSIDTGGSLNGKTSYGLVEIPADATQVQFVFGNAGNNAYTISAASAWGTSQVAPAGSSLATPGISLYDQNGNALTGMALLSFGNGGADSSPDFGWSQSVPAVSTSLTTASSSPSGATSINFATNFTCPANGSKILIIGSTGTNPVLYAQDFVSSCVSATGVLTATKNNKQTIPSGTTVYFEPPNFTVPANAAAPETALYFSDWSPVQTYPRLDGPIRTGETILVGGSPISGTVSSLGATSATLSANLAADIPAKSTIQACQVGVTTATVTPNTQIVFNSNTAIVSGMIFAPVAFYNPASGVSGAFDWLPNTVASVSQSAQTTVTAANPISAANAGTNWTSGTTFYFFVPGVTVAANAAAGQNQFTVNSTTGLSVGMTAFSSANNNTPGTISAISGNTITMSSNLTNGNGVNGVLAGAPIVFYTTATVNTTSVQNINLTFSSTPPNTLVGMQIVGANIPANDTVYSVNATTITLDYQPSATLNSGSTVYVCETMTTSADSPAGQANISLPYTTYPNKLLAFRMDHTGSYTNDWNNVGNMPSAMYNMQFANGSNPAFVYNSESVYAPTRYVVLGGNCATEGVLNYSGIGNGAGGCGNGFTIVPYAIKVYSPARGVVMQIVGDSHFAGDTTPATANGTFVGQAADYFRNTTTLPVYYLNSGRGGQPSMVYFNDAVQMTKSLHPSIVAIQYTTPNDDGQVYLTDVSNMTGQAIGLASLVQQYGGLPIVVSDYQRQAIGISSESTTSQTFRLYGETQLNNDAAAGFPTMDLSAITGNATWGQLYFCGYCSLDGIHNDTYGHGLIAQSLEKLLAPYLRN